ncbi:MAG: hypothetical protein K9N49_01720 [Candidatus Marinimicrobia bacterium]|nr:hypothetical protein [Candidatus Neomarinimicrobiota bacterium]
MKTITRSLGLLVWLAMTTVHAQVPAPLPPFTVYGKAANWSGRAFSSNDAAAVVAKINGVEMDRCQVVSGIYPELNYRVHIPMASAPTPGRGVVGDPLTFEVYYDGTMHTVMNGTSNPVVGETATALQCNLIVGTDSAGDGLPDEYKQLLLPYYIAAGWGTDLSDILPEHDFDGDDYSNYQEFLAGTIPVDGSDYPRIHDIFPAGSNSVGVAFLAAPGRTYTLPRSDNLVSNQWTDAELSLSSNVPPNRTFYGSEKDQIVTLYLFPTNQAAFRLDVR